MRKVLLVLIIIAILSPFAAAQKRALTHNDLYNMKRVTDPQISPDGKMVAYVVTVYTKSENKNNSDIWIVPAAGGEPFQLTASPKTDSRPRWSPDGNTIAFMSTRDGSPQIYTIPVNGGEAVKVTDIATGATGHIWAPGGEYFAYVSQVNPNITGDAAQGKFFEEKANSKVQAKIFDRLMYRHWNEWTNDTRYHVFVTDMKGMEPIDVTPGDYDTPPISLGGAQDYAISPDGLEMAFVRNDDPVIATSTNNDIFVTNRQLEMRKITSNAANDHSPVYSPDGKYIAYAAMARAGFEADKQTIMLYNRETEEITPLTDGIDRSASQIVWAPDGSKIYFRANDKAQVSIYSVDVATKEIKQLTDDAYTSNLSVSPDGSTLYFLSQQINMPSEVFKMSSNGGIMTQLTSTNDELLVELDMNPIEEFWVEGAKKAQVHGLIVKPPNFDPTKKYPMIYLVHGGPQGMWGNNFHYRWSAQLFAAPGYVVVMVNPRGSTGYGQKFTDEISQDWGGKVFTDLKNGLKYAVEKLPYVDRNRLATAGASYGGYMMNWFGTHMDELPYEFKAIVNHDGVFNTESMYLHTEELWFPAWEFGGKPWDKKAKKIYDKWSPHKYITNFKTPTLVIHSELDFRVPISESFQLFTALQEMGVPSKFLYFPDEDHWIHKPLNSELWYKTIHDWIGEYTK